MTVRKKPATGTPATEGRRRRRQSHVGQGRGGPPGRKVCPEALCGRHDAAVVGGHPGHYPDLRGSPQRPL